MTNEIDIVLLIDGTIRDCVAARIPPLPAIIAQTFAAVLCAKQTPEEHAKCVRELLPLVLERIQFLSVISDVVN